MIDFKIYHADNTTRYVYYTHQATYNAAFYNQSDLAVLYRSSYPSLVIHHYSKAIGWCDSAIEKVNVEISSLSLEEITAVILLDEI